MENKSEHLCVLCNNKLESKEALKEHFRKHANKEIDGKGRPVGPNGESVVDVAKLRSYGYEKGSASKFVDGEIVCDVCGEKFKCNTMAIQHKFKKHPKAILKHYCPQCGMQFPLKIHRDKHLENHTYTKPLHEATCNDCGASFYNKTALEYHSKSTHQRIIALYRPVLTPPPSKKIKVNNAGDPQSVYYCHLCGFEYIVKFNLQKHLEKQHSQAERDNGPPEMIKCTTCDALFYSQKAYQNHNMYHKPDDLYVTSEQQRLQTVTRVDQDFDIRRVQLGVEKYLPTYRTRRRRTPARQPEKKKQEKESSDEMSPPSSMDSSSDSDSEKPINKRIKKDEENDNELKETANDSKEQIISDTKLKNHQNNENTLVNIKQIKPLGKGGNKNRREIRHIETVDDDSDCVVVSEDST